MINHVTPSLSFLACLASYSNIDWRLNVLDRLISGFERWNHIHMRGWLTYDLLFRSHAAIAELMFDLLRMQNHLVWQGLGSYLP